MAWSTLARLVAPGGIVERIAHGVYRLRGAPVAEHLELRAAWLQLAPDVPAWERAVDSGVVSHRSAAAVYGLGHLAADVHEFTLPVRRQTRRPDVRLHRGLLKAEEWITLQGLPVTRPSRIAADLLAEREDPGAVGYLIADALRGSYDDPTSMAVSLVPLAARFGLPGNDGLALLRWVLELTDAPETDEWLAVVRDETMAAERTE